jgi:hypothetical protein
MKRPAERKVWSQPIQGRFEPSHLAEACVADAYACLVPPVWRRPGTLPSILELNPGRGTDSHERRGKEGRQCC